jgi:hypothetical protein
MLEGDVPFLPPMTMVEAAVALQGIGPFHFGNGGAILSFLQR